jgi:hypothetical protein
MNLRFGRELNDSKTYKLALFESNKRILKSLLIRAPRLSSRYIFAPLIKRYRFEIGMNTGSQGVNKR